MVSGHLGNYLFFSAMQKQPYLETHFSSSVLMLGSMDKVAERKSDFFPASKARSETVENMCVREGGRRKIINLEKESCKFSS